MIQEDHPSFKWLILLTVIIGTFLGRLDETIVNLALPKIIMDFKITVNTASWIATAYILANSVFVPIWGKLGDTIGRKKVYIMGFSIFIFGSLLAGLAWDLNSMIVFRIIQAIASSADYPTAMAILAVTFKQGRERAQAMGLWSTAFAAAVVFGPILGGPMIDNFGWRSIFLLNIPVGIVGLVMASVFVRESVGEKSINFDWWGALTLGSALSSLVLVLDQGLIWGWWALPSVICYASVIIFTAIFIFIEKRTEEPIVDLKFFENNIFVATIINNFIVFMALAGAIFLIPIFAETYLGLNATQTGYLFIPMAFCMVIGSPIGAALTGRVQPRFVIFISTMIAALGAFMFTFYLDPRATSIDIIIPLIVLAFGLGFGMAQRTSVIAAVVPSKEIGVASSILALARNIAQAFGIAVFSTLLTDTVNSNVINIAYRSTIKILNPTVYKQAIGLIILAAQVDAYKNNFFWAMLILLCGAFLSLTINIPKEKLRGGAHREEAMIEV